MIVFFRPFLKYKWYYAFVSLHGMLLALTVILDVEIIVGVPDIGL